MKAPPMGQFLVGSGVVMLLALCLVSFAMLGGPTAFREASTIGDTLRPGDCNRCLVYCVKARCSETVGGSILPFLRLAMT